MRFLVGADVDPDPNLGVAGSVLSTNRALEKLGHEVDEIWRADLGRRIRHGNLHYWLELPRAFRREVARRMARKKYDVVLLSQPYAYLAGRYIRHEHPATLFLNETHGWEGQSYEAMRRYLPPPKTRVSWPRRLAQDVMRNRLARYQAHVVGCADGIVAGCSAVAQYLQATYGYPLERVGVIPHGVPDVFLKMSIPAAHADRWGHLLHVAQFAPFKAPHVVAQVMSAVLKRHPAAKAGWVCDANHHLAVRHLFDPGILDRLTLYPWVPQDQLIDIYDQYGLFLFASYYEGYGKTPFEAMARGLAVVSTEVGGMADAIHHGENGFLCAPGHPETMVQLVEQLLADPGLAHRLGATAAATARSLTWESHATRLVEFAENLRRRNNESRGPGQNARGFMRAAGPAVAPPA
jgi:glycosyltransferase involved in cell wall biosynthesis